MSLILSNDDRYYNLDKVDRAQVAFNVIMGGRGTGKTFTSLTRGWQLGMNDAPYWIPAGKFIYMRTTSLEAESCCTLQGNPFKTLNLQYGAQGMSVTPKYNSKLGIGNFLQEDKEIGYMISLAGSGRVRSIDFNDVTLIIWEEFIIQKGVRRLSNVDDLFFNLYETVNRNRELDRLNPRPPVIVIFLSNSVTLDNPILDVFGIPKIYNHLKRTETRSYTDKSRQIHFEDVKARISEEKKGTALYKATQGTDFYAHSIENEFAYDSFSYIEKVDYQHYVPYIAINDYCIWRHKIADKLHISKSIGSCDYNYQGEELRRFMAEFGGKLLLMIIEGKVTFSDFTTKAYVYNLFGNKLQM